MIARVLLFILIAWAGPASAQFPMLEPQKAKYPQCKKEIREARKVLDLGKADQAIALCTACIGSKKEPWAYYVRARARLFQLDTLGYCQDMVEAWGLPEGARMEFKASCITKDSGSISMMKLDPERFPDVTTVTKELLRTDSRQQFGLYDQCDTLLASFVVDDGDTLYNHLQEPAEYGKGNKLLYPWLQGEIEYPDSALHAKVHGTVYVRFVVDEQGHVHNPKILHSPADILSKEVLRAMALMPTWKPAEAFGRPVKCLFSIPVQFKVK